MTARGCWIVAGVECTKLLAQTTARIALAVCAIGPFVFAVLVNLQDALPEDTLFGRSVKESGFAVSLVILGFAGLWLLPVVASLVSGDVFAAEDRHGTWKTVLTRSRSRAEIFAGKAMVAAGFSCLAVAVLAASSMAAGALVIGRQPLVALTGVPLSPADATSRVLLAWTSVLPPVLAFTALALLCSVATRSSAAGIGLPVTAGLAMQLYAFIDGPEPLRQAFIASGFGAWHGLLAEPPFHGPIVYGGIVSAIYVIMCTLLAYRLLLRRDIGG